jgi:limonene-1,2-epoxide hydrolase
MSETPLELVRRFCDEWSGGDLDAIVAYFTDDAVYHNIPIDPVTGKDAIKATIAGFTGGVDKIEFRVHHIVADGSAGKERTVVLTERTDVFVTSDKSIELPVMGTFEVAGGKIAAWRDYFDMNQFMSQLAG